MLSSERLGDKLGGDGDICVSNATFQTVPQAGQLEMHFFGALYPRMCPELPLLKTHSSALAGITAAINVQESGAEPCFSKYF